MNKIGWCSQTFNPVWGCRNRRCPYCYARTFAKRFGKKRAENECYYRYENNIGTNPYTKRAFIKCTERLRNFKPTFLYSQFNKKFPQKTQKIFVGSMSEIFFWKTVWVLKVLDKIVGYPQHVFQFLTKYPDVYLGYKFPGNCHLGVTITKIPKSLNNERMSIIEFLHDTCFDNLKFISFEPLLECIDFKHLDLRNIGWVIIGAETGKRIGKVIPDPLWIENIVRHCRNKNIPIYLKSSLKNIYPEEIKEFPIARVPS